MTIVGKYHSDSLISVAMNHQLPSCKVYMYDYCNIPPKQDTSGSQDDSLSHWDKTSSSAMAERPRELGDFKKARVNGGTDNQSLKDSQFPQVFLQPPTDPHHMVIK